MFRLSMRSFSDRAVMKWTGQPVQLQTSDMRNIQTGVGDYCREDICIQLEVKFIQRFLPQCWNLLEEFFFFQTNFIEVKLTYNKCTCFNCTFCINLYNHVTTTIIKMSVSQSVILVTQLCLTLRPHGLQHARLPCSSPIPGACSNLCSLSR